MIDKKELAQVIDSCLEGRGLFVVSITVSADNVIDVALDSDEGSVTIDDCVLVNDAVLAAFDRDQEDYELTVGSYGLTSPLLLPRQYRKYVGGEVEVLTRDGRKLKGVLKSADDAGFVLGVTVKVKPEGKKRPELQEQELGLTYDDIKYTKNIIKV